MSSIVSSPVGSWLTGLTRRTKAPTFDSSILTQRKSSFTALSSEGRKRLNHIVADTKTEIGQAQLRAFLLCCRVLPDEELRRLLDTNEVLVRVGKVDYSIHMGGCDAYGSDVYVRMKVDDHEWTPFCVSIDSDPPFYETPLPSYDQVAAYYLALTTNQRGFHHEAVLIVSPHDDPEGRLKTFLVHDQIRRGVASD